jgi:hypothetical protein
MEAIECDTSAHRGPSSVIIRSGLPDVLRTLAAAATIGLEKTEPAATNQPPLPFR